jgi:hypothetical protein
MNLKFESRPVAGQDQRPTPEIALDRDLNAIVVAFPWGPREAAQRAIQRIFEYLRFTRQDREATSPLPKLTCLSDAGNAVRTALELANSSIFREENREEYLSGLEIFVATLDETEFCWAQVGGPQVFLARGEQYLQPIGAQMDLAFDLQPAHKAPLPILPNRLVGLDQSVMVDVRSFRARPEDKIILLAHSCPPPQVYTANSRDLSDDLKSGHSLIQKIAAADPHRAFWFGQISIEATDAEREALSL